MYANKIRIYAVAVIRSNILKIYGGCINMSNRSQYTCTSVSNVLYTSGVSSNGYTLSFQLT